MISFLSNWIEQIAIAVIIASIFEMILPKGTINKYVKMVLGIYVVFNIISPFVDSDALYSFNVSSIEDYSESLNINKSSVNQDSMDRRLEDLYIEQIETNIINKVDELGYVAEKCDVEAELDSSKPNSGINRIDLVLREKQNENDVRKVQVNEISIGNILKFNNDDGNEKINELKKSIAEYYEVNEDIINIKIK